MPELLVVGSEGEWALFENSLDGLGTDDKRRGSVLVNIGNQMFKDFGEVADCWVHVRLATLGNPTNSGADRDFLFIRDALGRNIFGLRNEDIDFTNQWQVSIRWSGSPGSGFTQLTGEVFPAESGEFIDWDFNILITTNIDPNDTMTLRAYRSGQLRFSRTLTDAAGWPLPSQLLLEARTNNTNSNQDNTYYQDVVVSDGVPTVGMELATLVPAAVGNYFAFQNDYTNIDDVGYDPSTVISTTVANVRESWVFAVPTFDLGDKVIYGVVLDTVAQTDLAAIVSDFQPFLRISATDYPGNNLGANPVNPDSYVTVYTDNPATGQPWQEIELQGLEAGILALP